MTNFLFILFALTMEQFVCIEQIDRLTCDDFYTRGDMVYCWQEVDLKQTKVHSFAIAKGRFEKLKEFTIQTPTSSLEALLELDGKLYCGYSDGLVEVRDIDDLGKVEAKIKAKCNECDSLRLFPIPSSTNSVLIERSSYEGRFFYSRAVFGEDAKIVWTKEIQSASWLHVQSDKLLVHVDNGVDVFRLSDGAHKFQILSSLRAAEFVADETLLLYWNEKYEFWDIERGVLKNRLSVQKSLGFHGGFFLLQKEKKQIAFANSDGTLIPEDKLAPLKTEKKVQWLEDEKVCLRDQKGGIFEVFDLLSKETILRSKAVSIFMKADDNFLILNYLSKANGERLTILRVAQGIGK